MTGQPKLRFRLSPEVLRQARSGPNASQEKKRKPPGIIILLKNGAPTLMRLLVTIGKDRKKRAGENGDAGDEEEAVG